MNKSFLVVATALVALSYSAPVRAQLAGSDTAPGSSCAGFPQGASRMTADPDNDRAGITLICDGTNWVVQRPNFSGTCTNNAPITFDSVTGNLRCGPSDVIAPVWVTAAGVIATHDVNDMVNSVVAASDESGSPAYQKISGASWINVAPNGAVTGKAPATGGTYAVTVRAVDAAGNSPADRTFDIVVNPPGGPVGCVNHGDVCPDGTIYAGKTPDGNVDFFVMQQDLPGGEIYSFHSGVAGAGLNTGLPDCTNGGTQSTCRTGESNTNTLVTIDSQAIVGFQIHEAALACYCLGETHANAPDGIVPPQCAGNPAGTNAFDGHGFDDWYLPAVAELDVIIVNLRNPNDLDNPTWQDGADGGNDDSTVGGGPQEAMFSHWWKWTSSEYADWGAWTIIQPRGQYDFMGKDETYSVRCARK